MVTIQPYQPKIFFQLKKLNCRRKPHGKKNKRKIEKIVYGVKHTFKKGKEYGEKDILNGG